MVAAAGRASQECSEEAASISRAGGGTGGIGGARDIQSIWAVHLASAPLELRVSHPRSVRLGGPWNPALCRCVTSTSKLMSNLYSAI